MVKHILIVTFIFSGCAIFSSQGQGTGYADVKESKQLSFAVMPFVRPEHRTYNPDEVQWAFVNVLKEKGYDMDVEDAQWKRLAELDFSLYDLNKKQARQISQLLQIDYLIYGYREHPSQQPLQRFHGVERKVINRDIVVKVYDRQQKKVILYERLRDREDWGLWTDYKNVREMAREFVSRLQMELVSR